MMIGCSFNYTNRGDSPGYFVNKKCAVFITYYPLPHSFLLIYSQFRFRNMLSKIVLLRSLATRQRFGYHPHECSLCFYLSLFLFLILISFLFHTKLIYLFDFLLPSPMLRTTQCTKASEALPFSKAAHDVVPPVYKESLWVSCASLLNVRICLFDRSKDPA